MENWTIKAFLIGILLLLFMQLVVELINLWKIRRNTRELDSKSYYELKSRITLIFQVFLVTGAILGYFGFALSQDISKYKDEITALEEKQDLINEDFANISQKLEGYQDQIDQLGGNISKVNNKYSQLNDEISNSIDKIDDRLIQARIKRKIEQIRNGVQVTDATLLTLMGTNINMAYYEDYKYIYLDQNGGIGRLPNKLDFDCHFIKEFQNNLIGDKDFWSKTLSNPYRNGLTCFSKNEYKNFFKMLLVETRAGGGVEQNLNVYEWIYDKIYEISATQTKVDPKRDIPNINFVMANNNPFTYATEEIAIENTTFLYLNLNSFKERLALVESRIEWLQLLESQPNACDRVFFNLFYRQYTSPSINIKYKEVMNFIKPKD